MNLYRHPELLVWRLLPTAAPPSLVEAGAAGCDAALRGGGTGDPRVSWAVPASTSALRSKIPNIQYMETIRPLKSECRVGGGIGESGLLDLASDTR